MSARPDGKRLMLAGKVAFVAGILGYVFPMFSHPVHDIIALLALLGMFLGGLAWMVGYVVFAISFIPGTGD